MRQIRNTKYSVQRKKQGQNDQRPFRNTFGDHVLEVSNKVHDRPQFVRDTHLHAKVPSVVLYTDMTVALTRQMCCQADAPSVLGIDRTFNLGDVYVTVTSFKHQGLLRRTTNEPPIVFGPMLLHGSATWEVYSGFLTTVGDSFGTRKQPSLVVGSDDEKAIRRAISESFTQSTNALCTLHLKKNVDDFLQNKVGLAAAGRKQVAQAIFGQHGAVAAENHDVFHQRIEAVKELVAGLTPNAAKFNEEYLYGRRQLVQLLRTGVLEPNMKHGIGYQWTNNNSESANHVLKAATQWKSLPLPDLVDKLHQVVKTQETDIARALYGAGNYMLAPSREQYAVPSRRWAGMEPKQRLAKIWNFVQDRRPRKQNNMSSSTNGSLHVPTTPSRGKKGHQGKRKSAEKTRSGKKLKLK
jgi:hypothetical protein